jgi:hypothetical protein
MADTRWRKFTNNAACRLLVSIGVPDATVQLEAGLGAVFPALAINEICKIVVRDIKTGAFEIMACTARTGDVLTVDRAQEGTSAQAFNRDQTVVFHQVTADDLEYLQDLLI